MWVVFGIVVGVAIGLVIALVARKMPADRRQPNSEELFQLGIILAAAGFALVTTIGMEMVGLGALGVVFILAGVRRRRDESSRT